MVFLHKYFPGDCIHSFFLLSSENRLQQLFFSIHENSWCVSAKELKKNWKFNSQNTQSTQTHKYTNTQTHNYNPVLNWKRFDFETVSRAGYILPKKDESEEGQEEVPRDWGEPSNFRRNNMESSSFGPNKDSRWLSVWKLEDERVVVGNYSTHAG